MDTNAALIDVIIPIYNVEAYLPQCLDGFLHQTSRAFRVLMIDDGSTDNSGEIAKGYADKYPSSFVYVRQENKGLGGARNTGFSLVTAPYTWFFDSDDFCAPTAIEHLAKAVENHPGVDIIFFNPTIYDMAAHSYQPWHDEDYIRFIFHGRDLISPKDDPRTLELEASVCRNLWRSEFLRECGLSFMEHVCWEDVPPHFALMHAADSAAFLDVEGCYYYRINAPRKNQITAGTGKSRLDMAPVLAKTLSIIKEQKWNKRDKAFLINFMMNYCLWSLRCTQDAYRKQLVDILHGFFGKFSFFFGIYYVCRSKACGKNKLSFLLFRSPLFYRMAYKRSTSARLKKFFLGVKKIVKRR